MMPRNRFLPQDIMLCILTRLPVESLVRFKSVCKSWCELFSAPEFIKMHINQFSDDPKNEALIIHCYQGYLIGSEEKKPMINLYFPECLFTVIVGCLHGLVCMVTRGDDHDDRFVLWNPALKLFNTVKFPNQEDLSSQCRWNFDLLRLGYDAEEADFKVVLPIRHKRENPFDKALVYSANSDSWKKIDMDLEFFLLLDTRCSSGHENPHWNVKVDDKRVLVYLDVRNMVFKSVPFSPNWKEKSRVVVKFMDWKGSIGAILWNFGSGRNIEIWVLCDGDEEKIWRKYHTFETIDVFPGSFRLGSFRLCTKNGKHITVDLGSFRLCTKNGKLIVVDPKEKPLVFDPEIGCIVEEIISDGNYTCQEVYRYTKSLVYFKGMNKIVQKKKPSISQPIGDIEN